MYRPYLNILWMWQSGAHILDNACRGIFDILTKLHSMKRSNELNCEASKLMPDGVTDSIFIDNARGSHVWDVDGNEYIDYKLGWGPVILGHSHRAVLKRVHEYDTRGLTYGLSNPMEIALARKIKSLVPCAEMIRYFVSGTEATMHAIRIARAYTKKRKGPQIWRSLSRFSRLCAICYRAGLQKYAYY